jgi:hypothetical protein
MEKIKKKRMKRTRRRKQEEERQKEDEVVGNMETQSLFLYFVSYI